MLRPLIASHLLLVLGAFCATAHGENRPGLRPGEAFTYSFSVAQAEGARARMSIGLPVKKKGRSLVAVQGQAETVAIVALVAPLNDTYQLVIDTDTLLPEDVVTQERGLRERKYVSHVEGRALDLEVTTPQRSAHYKRMLPREARDPLSAYFALRASELKDGDHLELDVIDGAMLWRTTLRVVGRETITLAEDTTHAQPPARAIHIEGDLLRIDDVARPVPRVRPRTISCWLADDATRVLLRASFDTEIGRASLELTGVQAPKRKPEPRQAAALPGILVAGSAKPAAQK